MDDKQTTKTSIFDDVFMIMFERMPKLLQEGKQKVKPKYWPNWYRMALSTPKQQPSVWE